MLAAGVRLEHLSYSLHQYSIAGDDSVTEGVTDLVRGTLCPALKALFEHGLKKPSLLGGACHPWLFIEEVMTAGPCAHLSLLLGLWTSSVSRQRAPGLLHLVHTSLFHLEARKRLAR